MLYDALSLLSPIYVYMNTRTTTHGEENIGIN